MRNQRPDRQGGPQTTSHESRTTNHESRTTNHAKKLNGQTKPNLRKLNAAREKGRVLPQLKDDRRRGACGEVTLHERSRRLKPAAPWFIQ